MCKNNGINFFMYSFFVQIHGEEFRPVLFFGRLWSRKQEVEDEPNLLIGCGWKGNICE